MTMQQLDDPVEYISAKTGLASAVVLNVLGALSAYETMREAAATPPPTNSLHDHLLNAKATWEEDLLSKFPPELIKREVDGGRLLSVSSRSYPGKTFYCVKDDGTFDLTSLAADRLPRVVDFIFTNRTKPLNFRGYVENYDLINDSSRNVGRPRKKTSPQRQRILDLLRRGQLSVNEISTRAEMKCDNARQLLSKMARANEVVRVSRAVYGLPQERSAAATSNKEKILLEFLGDGQQHTWEELVNNMSMPRTTLRCALNSPDQKKEKKY
jgi:hypothetical protein